MSQMWSEVICNQCLFRITFSIKKIKFEATKSMNFWGDKSVAKKLT